MSINLIGTSGDPDYTQQDVTFPTGLPDGNTTEGNFLLVWVQSNDHTATSFPITCETDGWDLVVSTGTDYNWSGLWSAPAGADEPTFSDEGAQIKVGALCFSGIATSDALDQTGSATQADPAQCADPDTAAGDLIFALSTWNGANSGTTLSQALYGSNGTELTAVVAQSNAVPPATNEPGMLFIASYQQNDLTLGTYGNKVSASSTEYEGYVSSLIASFKAV